MTSPILVLDRISRSYRRPDGSSVKAVDDVSLTVEAGETITLVGESGSGKSTLGRIALGLEKPDSGDVIFLGKRLKDLRAREFRDFRTAMQPIFQDASASLNPRRTVSELMAQSLRLKNHDVEAQSVSLLNQVGLRPGTAYIPRFPHELSGGQKQRLAIARALAMEPSLIIADEPLSGSDVSIRGQILNLLIEIKRARNATYLMITHDISVARAFGDRVAVMQNGKLVEIGPAEQVLGTPSESYTQRLVAAVLEPPLGNLRWA
jgi:ABC-type glutathione transport system ATPase component